jgi:small subunit ribosomal protein S4e
MQRLVKVDGKVRTDKTFPTGFQGLRILACLLTALDVVSIEKTGEHFRIMYDTKGRFVVHKITDEESKVPSLYFAGLTELVQDLRRP